MSNLNSDNEAQGAGVGQISQKETVATRLKGLSSKQQDKFYAMYPTYGDQAFDMLDHFKTRRNDLWSDFLENSNKLNSCTPEDALYPRAVTETFDIGEYYTKHEIVLAITDLRKQYDKEPYKEEIAVKALKEFKRFYLFEEHHVGEGKDKTKAYKPVFAVFAR